MQVTLEITDKTIENAIKAEIGKKLSENYIDSIVEAKIGNKVSEILKTTLSESKIDSFVRDRVSRIITTESLKEYTFGLADSDVLSNLEAKILLMIKNSKDFRDLVRVVLKNSL